LSLAYARQLPLHSGACVSFYYFIVFASRDPIPHLTLFEQTKRDKFFAKLSAKESGGKFFDKLSTKESGDISL
ncbi:MAG: hypothetical protein IJD37_05130, partial [Clostridia bacterium]|nr:hypothetical protein [Clostridia bacterium]